MYKVFQDFLNVTHPRAFLVSTPVDRDGVLWFGPDHGLFSFKNGEVSSFTEQEGLPKGSICVIIEDRAGSLWIGSRGGLTRLSKGRFTTWTEQDGLPSNNLIAHRLGLTKALEHAVHLVADAADLRISTQLEPLDGLLAQEAEIHLYRLVQECLNNIVKHARASFVEVRAWSADGYLRCSVRDNGEGFDYAGCLPDSGARFGMGLAGMTERMRLLGGQITIRSQPGSGTLVEARLPIQTKDRA